MSKCKPTLSQAIEISKIAIEDSSKIVIDTVEKHKLSSSKKRKSLSTSFDGSSIQPHSLREEVLSLLKFKDDDIMDLQTELEISEKRIQKLNAYVKLMEQKLELQGSVINTNSSSSVTSSQETFEIDHLTRIIKFYEMVTSMAVKIDDTDQNKYICTVKNKAKRIGSKFSISYKSEDELAFQPIANANILPEYLRSEISFEVEMAPVLTSDVLQSLYEETDDENNK